MTTRDLYAAALELERTFHDAGQHEAAAHVARARCLLAVEVTRAQQSGEPQMTDHDPLTELAPAPVAPSLSAEDREWLRSFVALFLATNRHEHPRTAIDLGLGALHALRGR